MALMTQRKSSVDDADGADEREDGGLGNCAKTGTGTDAVAATGAGTVTGAAAAGTEADAAEPSEMDAIPRSGMAGCGGRDNASATKLLFPWMYLMSVLNSEMHDSWYCCRAVNGSDFFPIDGTND